MCVRVEGQDVFKREYSYFFMQKNKISYKSDDYVSIFNNTLGDNIHVFYAKYDANITTIKHCHKSQVYFLASREKICYNIRVFLKDCP